MWGIVTSLRFYYILYILYIIIANKGQDGKLEKGSEIWKIMVSHYDVWQLLFENVYYQQKKMCYISKWQYIFKVWGIVTWEQSIITLYGVQDHSQQYLKSHFSTHSWDSLKLVTMDKMLHQLFFILSFRHWSCCVSSSGCCLLLVFLH